MLINVLDKVYLRSQILERPSIGEYGNILGVPVSDPLPKGPLLATKWAENGVFVRELRGEVQKVHFLGPKGPHFGVLPPPPNRS